MSEGIAGLRFPRERGTDTALWVAAAASLVVHAFILLGLPAIRPPLLEPDKIDVQRSLSVNLVPLIPVPPSPPPARPVPVPPTQASRAPRPQPAPEVKAPRSMQPSVPPPVIALKPPAPSVATPKPVRPAAEGDLSSYIEAKRRARAEQQAAASVASPQAAPAPEDEGARRDRIAAANLALPPAQAFGYDPKRRGGAFQLRRVGVDDAEFIFFGWDKNVGRSRPQMFEVRRGDNPDIQLAVVRRIIAIIREFEQGDFRWHSSRTSSSVILSARASDNAQLEQFMMEEFFPGRSVR